MLQRTTFFLNNSIKTATHSLDLEVNLGSYLEWLLSIAPLKKTIIPYDIPVN